MKPEQFSILGLYGNRAFFKEMFDQGCDWVQSGGGPWIEGTRIVNILVFSKEGWMVAASVTAKQGVYGTSMRSTFTESWESPEEAEKYLTRWKITLGEKQSIRDILGKWDE